MKRFCTILLALAVLLTVLPLPGQAAAAAMPEEFTEPEGRVLLLTNRERLKEGLQPLTAPAFLQQVCHIRAEELLTHFSHTRPDGSSCFTALNAVEAPACQTAGENIAAGHPTPEEVVEGWMNSEGHRANILDPAFAHMGVGERFGYSQKLQWECSSWVQFFFTGFDCGYTSLKLLVPGKLTAGSSVDDMGIWAELTCGDCGVCRVPVMTEFCTGYDPDTAEAQTVTVKLFGLEADFTIQPAVPAPTDPEPTDPEPAEPDGWVPHSGRWYYWADGEKVTGWQRLTGSWFWFDSDGVMQTGWQQIGGSWYYFHPSGYMLTGWQRISGSWFRFDGSGAMQTGWQQIDGSWYYFHPSGYMLTGWQRIGGSWYYLRDSGSMVTGWRWIDGKCYYFNESGRMVCDAWIDGSYVDGSGVWIPGA